MDKTAMQRADRISGLRADLGKLDLGVLKTTAATAGIELAGDETREEIEYAIAEAAILQEERAEAAAAQREADEKARAERERFYKTPEGKAQKEKDDRDAAERSIRSVHSGFIKALPQEARSTGAFEVKRDAPEAGDHPVPDGNYRVAGSDWVMSFKRKKWSGAFRAHARGEPDWTEIPDTPGGAVGAPAPKGEQPV